jgi:type III secretion protein U
MADRPSGARTEDPTPRRLQQARRAGQAARSRDLLAAVSMGAVAVTFLIDGQEWFGRLLGYLRLSLASATREVPPTAAAAQALVALALAFVPAAVVSWIVVLAVGWLQGGFSVNLNAGLPDVGRVMPKLNRLFSAAALGEAGKGLVVAAALLVIGASTVVDLAAPLLSSAGASAPRVLTLTGEAVARLISRCLLFACVWGVLDYLWQRHRHQRSLKMTREEVLRDHRESEGDPRHRAERQRIQRQLSEQQILSEIRKATVVVVNPDHIAVALRYEADGQAAPVLLAKGERLMAEQIKAIAREAGVPILRDVGLARALCTLEPGDEIPETLYEAVAEVLRVVQRLNEGPDKPPPATAPSEPAPDRSHWRRG